ncbi:unnamed protein product [Nezara viridula]|uniref:Uncharacterized protein n=1 Tax=Nezara viridula TaxID=85310 RepID=A0A9P0MX89_NEZVI|nr:unnamed protein product [Nezara viridula]
MLSRSQGKSDYDDPEFPKEAKLKADGSFDKEKDKEAVEEIVKDEVLKAKLMAAIDECDVTDYDDPEFPKEAKMKADGSFDKEKDKEAVEEIVKDEVLKAKLMAAIDECDVTANADKCEAAYEFVKCKKAKLKADGSFDKEKDKEAVEEIVKDEVLKAKLMAAIDECDVTAKADKCEAAYEFVKCKKAKAGPH